MKEFFQNVIDYIKASFKWVFTRDTLRNVLFGIRVSRTLLEKKNNGISKQKSKEILRKLEIGQNIIDSIMKNMPNQYVERFVQNINANQDDKTLKDFSAEICPNKHGNGNNGINLNIIGSLLGLLTKVF